jgi:histidinol-phosphatase (PHP family)
MNYLYDYHIHTNYSTDGKSSIFDVCESAIKKGLKEIAITDHFEPTIMDQCSESYRPNDSWVEIIKANELFKGKLKIKMGVELGQPHLFLNTSKQLVNSVPYDYVIGSAHKLPSGMDVSQIDYSNVTLEDVCHTYINQIKQLVEQADFDCVGHIDLIKRYCTNHYDKRVTLITQYELLKEVFKIIILNRRGIEINTSGLRQAPKEAMPGIDVLKLYRELGGEILTIGSDAHNAKDVAEGIEMGIESAKQAGFNYLTLFNNRIPKWVSINDSHNFYYIGGKKII